LKRIAGLKDRVVQYDEIQGWIRGDAAASEERRQECCLSLQDRQSRGYLSSKELDVGSGELKIWDDDVVRAELLILNRCCPPRDRDFNETSRQIARKSFKGFQRARRDALSHGRKEMLERKSRERTCQSGRCSELGGD
jgi:hypothetical protein